MQGCCTEKVTGEFCQNVWGSLTDVFCRNNFHWWSSSQYSLSSMKKEFACLNFCGWRPNLKNHEIYTPWKFGAIQNDERCMHPWPFSCWKSTQQTCMIFKTLYQLVGHYMECSVGQEEGRPRQVLVPLKWDWCRQHWPEWFPECPSLGRSASEKSTGGRGRMGGREREGKVQRMRERTDQLATKSPDLFHLPSSFVSLQHLLIFLLRHDPPARLSITTNTASIVLIIRGTECRLEPALFLTIEQNPGHMCKQHSPLT